MAFKASKIVQILISLLFEPPPNKYIRPVLMFGS